LCCRGILVPERLSDLFQRGLSHRFRPHICLNTPHTLFLSLGDVDRDTDPYVDL